MQYTQAIFKITATEDFVKDVLTQRLADIEFESFVEQENDEYVAYIQTDRFSETALNSLLGEFEYGSVSLVKTELCEDRDWNEEWEKNSFQPIEVGKDCIIRAPFHEKREGFRHEIIINPKMAFGTGSHQTTYLILNTLLRMSLEGKTVLDMGCGTGVLGILAHKLGAKSVTAIDIDDWCTENAKENCELNGIGNMEILLGDARLLTGRKFDVIIANINRNILMMDMPQYKQALREGGELIMSGFYTEDIHILTDRAEEFGLRKTEEKSLDNWAMIRICN